MASGTTRVRIRLHAAHVLCVQRSHMLCTGIDVMINSCALLLTH